MNTDKKKYIWGVVAGVVIVILIIVLATHKRKNTPENKGGQDGPDSSLSANSSPVVAPNTSVSEPAAPAPSLSYNEALARYKGKFPVFKRLPS
jgi:hypothetical protein